MPSNHLTSPWTRGTRRVIAAFILGAVATLVGAAPASAHVDIVSVSPMNESVVPTTPESVVMTFNSEVDPDTIKVNLFYRDGTEFPWVGKDGEDFVVDGKTVTAYPPSLDSGTYVVTFSSTGPDGHIAADQFSFSVGAPSGQVGDLRSGAPLWIDALQSSSRWLLYVVVAVTLGLAVMAMLARRGRQMRRDPVKLVKLGAAAVVAAIVLRFVSVAVAIAFTGGISQIPTIVTTWKGALAWALMLVAASFILLRKGWAVITGAAIFALAETMTGHLMYTKPQLILVPLGALHLAGVLAWFGIPAAAIATLSIDRHTWYKALGVIAWPLAVAAPIVALTGPALYWVRTGGLDEIISSFGGAYGQIIIVKTLLLFAITSLAITHLIRRTRLGNDRKAGVTTEEASGSETLNPNELVDAVEESSEAPTEGSSDEHVPQVSSFEGVASKEKTFKTVRRAIKFEAALLAVVTLLGAALSGTAPKLATTATDLLAVPTDYQQCAVISNDADKFLCAARYFENVAKTDSVAAAIKDFSSRWQGNDVWIQSNCHQLGHRLGRIGWLTYKDIAKAFAQGSDPCDYGYMHGVIEGASAQFDEAELKASMTTMCEVIPGGIGEHTYRQCIHGLGHAAARRVNNDMPKAVEFCRVFYKDVKEPLSQSDSNWYKFHLCVTGISMEWNLSPKSYATAQLPIGADETLLGECGKLDDIFQPGCIEYATSPYAGQIDKLIQVRDWCDANLAEALPCYWSVGRDALVPWVTFPDAASVCLTGSSERNIEQCLFRMAGNIATRELDASKIDPFCEILPAKYLQVCRIAQDSMEALLKQMKRGYIVTKDNPGDSGDTGGEAGSSAQPAPASGEVQP